jgi:DNA-binding transcriptional ArsR family regulator
MTLSTKVVLAQLRRHAGELTVCKVELATLMAELGIGRLTVMRALRELEGLGYIRSRRHGRGLPNSYYLLDHDVPAAQERSSPMLTVAEKEVLRGKLVKKHDSTCAHCGRHGEGRLDPDGKSWTLDRVDPFGPYSPANLVLACRFCNTSRRRTPIGQFVSKRRCS